MLRSVDELRCVADSLEVLGDVIVLFVVVTGLFAHVGLRRLWKLEARAVIAGHVAYRGVATEPRSWSWKRAFAPAGPPSRRAEPRARRCVLQSRGQDRLEKRPHRRSRGGSAGTEYAEFVALGISEHNPGLLALADISVFRSEGEQALDLSVAIIRPEVEV